MKWQIKRPVCCGEWRSGALTTWAGTAATDPSQTAKTESSNRLRTCSGVIHIKLSNQQTKLLKDRVFLIYVKSIFITQILTSGHQCLTLLGHYKSNSFSKLFVCPGQRACALAPLSHIYPEGVRANKLPSSQEPEGRKGSIS